MQGHTAINVSGLLVVAGSACMQGTYGHVSGLLVASGSCVASKGSVHAPVQHCMRVDPAGHWAEVEQPFLSICSRLSKPST